MERIRQTAPDKGELIGIIDYNEYNLDTHRIVVMYGDNAPIRPSDLLVEDIKKQLKDILPKDILDKYEPDSLHFSPIVVNHTKELLVLTGIPIPQKPNS